MSLALEHSESHVAKGYLIAKSCLILFNPMDCSTPGFPVLPSLLEFVQTHIHWVSDAIQQSPPLLKKGVSKKCLLLRRLDEHTLMYEAMVPHPFLKKWSAWYLVWNWVEFFSHRHHCICPGDYEVNWNKNNTCMGLLKLDNENKNGWNIL